MAGLDEAVEDTLSNDLAAAWDASEDEETDDGIDTGGTPEPTASETGAATGTGDDPDPGTVPDTEKQVDTKEPAAGELKPVADEDAAPSSLPPAAREVWKDAPKALKDAVAQREKEYMVGIQKYAENAKRAGAMDQALAPFQQYFALNGNQPGQTINQLLQTGATLQMGTPVQRAQTIANLIGQFGVDIETLDNLLTGGAPTPQAQQQTQVQQAVQEAVQPYQQFMTQFQQNQQAQEQQMQHKVASEVEVFSADAKHEFYKDVSSSMADLLDMAANQNRELSMDEAYDTACQINPQIRQILQSRTSQQDVNEKRQAAASISGSPGGPGEGIGQPGSIREAIEQAWAQEGGSRI